MGDTRQDAHEIIDRLPESQITAVLSLLERIVEPTRTPSASRLDQGTDALKQVSEAVQASREVLRLEADWNGEEAATISEETWRRATEFLSRNAQFLWNEHSVRIETPRIVPVPDGTLDIHWKVAERELLVNIPAQAGVRATYYGDDGSGHHVVEGDLDTAAPNHWLLMWLSE
jgi:hypothetical protein